MITSVLDIIVYQKEFLVEKSCSYRICWQVMGTRRDRGCWPYNTNNRTTSTEQQHQHVSHRQLLQADILRFQATGALTPQAPLLRTFFQWVLFLLSQLLLLYFSYTLDLKIKNNLKSTMVMLKQFQTNLFIRLNIILKYIKNNMITKLI